MTEFTISEEIVRQSLEVKFRTNSKNMDEWFICFTNPTAGPWKKILFFTKDKNVVKVGGFGKEEKRPDLIIFSRKYKILLIIEAKDFLPELLKSHRKISKTFIDMESKLKELPLIKDEFENLFILNGLVFYSNNINKDFNSINRVYARSKNLISFIVTSDDADNLIIRGKSKMRAKEILPLKNIITF